MSGADQPKPAHAPRSEIFQVLLHAMEQYNQRVVSGALTTAAALLVAIGWLLTSGEAQEFFRQSKSAARLLIGAVVILAGIYCYAIYRAYGINRNAYRQLQALAYMNQEYYACHLLPRPLLVCSILLNVWHYGVIAWLVAHFANL